MTSYEIQPLIDALLNGDSSRACEEARKLKEKIEELQEKDKELYRANRGLRVLIRCNEALVRKAQESELLEKICRIIVDTGGYHMAWVGFAQHDENKTVLPVAQAGYEEGYLDKVNITWAPKERGMGPTGKAIRERRPSILRNILNDPNYRPWVEEASKRGYKSSIALPLIVDKQTLGALNIYSAEPDAFDKQEVKLLMELANNMAYGIKSLRIRKEKDFAEQKQEESEEKYQNMFENISSAVAVYEAVNNGEDFVFKDFNKAAEKIDNVKRENLIGRAVTEAFPSIKEFGLFDVFKQVWETGMPQHHPISFYSDERIEGWRENFVYKLSTGEIVAVYDDITEHKRQEQKIQESEQWLMTILKSIGDAVIVTDATGNIKFMNPVAEKLTKWSKEEAIDNSLENIFNILDEKNNEVFEEQIILIAKDGKKIPIEKNSASIKDEKGNFIGMVLVFRDITERRLIEEELKEYHEHLEEIVLDRTAELEKINKQLKEAEENLKQFVYSVSHELRTPISVLSQSISNLEDYEDKMSVHLKKKIIESISRNNKILTELVDDLLLASRMDGSKIELKWEIYKPLSVLQDVLEQIEPRRKVKEIDIKIDVDEDIQLVGDTDRIGQIFRIFIDNAIKYSNHRTTIRIVAINNYKGEFNPDAVDGVLIQFSDESIGIKKDELPNMFKPFFKSEDLRTIPGTGIGLSIAKTLIELHKGEIYIKSEYGKGSTFSLFLPRLEELT